MWECSICRKNKVGDKGKGFRFFLEYNVLGIIDIPGKDKARIDMWGNCKRQIRICDKCLGKNYSILSLT